MGAQRVQKPPAAPAVDLTPILRKLQWRQRWRAALRVLAFVFGLPLAFVAPVVLGTMFWLACGMLYRWYAWSTFFWGTSLVALPAMFITELRTGDHYLSAVISPEEAKRAALAQGVKTVGTLVYPRLGNTLMLAAALAAPRASMAGFIELFLTGPRLLLTAFRDVRMLKRLYGTDVELAAGLLHRLLQARVGVPLPRLALAGRTAEDVEQALAYLVFYDWAGVAADGSKAWILTQAIKELE